MVQSASTTLAIPKHARKLTLILAHKSIHAIRTHTYMPDVHSSLRCVRVPLIGPEPNDHLAFIFMLALCIGCASETTSVSHVPLSHTHMRSGLVLCTYALGNRCWMTVHYSHGSYWLCMCCQLDAPVCICVCVCTAAAISLNTCTIDSKSTLAAC